MPKSASLRLAALYAAAFTAAVILLGAVTVLTTRTTLSRQFDDRILAESAALAEEFRIEGLGGVVEAVQERDSTAGVLDYGVTDPGGRPVAGRLAQTGAPRGWSEQRVRSSREKIRVHATVLPGGYRLLVGGDDESIDTVDRLLAGRFGLAILGVVAIGLVGGFGLARGMGRRIAAITGAAEAIIDGDLSRRVPVARGGDDLGRLAATFNRMLDRSDALMESLRQVSSDIAHDLRTPLTRLRSRLEACLALPPGPAQAPTQAAAIEAALVELDAILETFAALLRIAQIEGGARRAGFRAFDLAGVARTVVDAFAPSAEEAGQRLTLEDGAAVMVDGDPELVTQMLVNLVENSLRHAGPQTRVKVGCHAERGRARLSVTDDGPGVPGAQRERLFDRFHRLEASRSTPGSGLGLALVAAVAKLHGADASLHEAHPGLEAVVAFPRRG